MRYRAQEELLERNQFLEDFQSCKNRIQLLERENASLRDLIGRSTR